MSERFANKGKTPTHDVPGCAEGFPHPPWETSHPKILTVDPGEKGRVIIVGDVQGCYDEFFALMELAELDPARGDKVVLVGDLVHNNSKSPGLDEGSLKLLRHARRNADHISVVRGNHEDGVLLSRLRGNEGHWAAGRLVDEDERWLATLPLQVRIPSHNVVVVHAGIDASADLDHQRHVVSTKLRLLVSEPPTRVLSDVKRWLPVESNWKSRDPNVPHDMAVPWAKLWAGPQHIVFGHDARKGLQLWPWATGLDTGASGRRDNGALTAMVLPPAGQAKPAGPCDPTFAGRPGMILSVGYDRKKYFGPK